MTLKKELGQFFTKNNLWLKPQVLTFIEKDLSKIVYDPFAGEGDLLNAVKKLGFKHTKGLDIDPTLNWELNDSLISIPKIKNSIIITNPPYLSNYSAKRQNLSDTKKYFRTTKHNDLYKIALENCLAVSDSVVAIVPETFITSTFDKSKAESITILENSPFEDTDFPICVVCFSNSAVNCRIYKNEKFIGYLKDLKKLKLSPTKNLEIKFNDPEGNVALRAIDGISPHQRIKFLKVEELNYNLKNIKVSSRLITIINIPELVDNKRGDFVKLSNEILEEFRIKGGDVLLSAFKGNNKIGIRRRRLDYKSARAILESAFKSINKESFYSSVDKNEKHYTLQEVFESSRKIHR